MNFRENTLLTGDDPDWAAGYTVNAYPVGAEVASASSGSTLTVKAGHSVLAGDKLLLRPGTDNEFTAAVSSVTSTTIVFSPETYGVSVGDLAVNLGPDTGTTTPNYDGSPVSIYQDSAGDTVFTNAAVTSSSQGEYWYYHRGAGRAWELVRDGDGTVVDVVTGFTAADRVNAADYGASSESADTTARVKASIDAMTAGEEFVLPAGDFTCANLDVLPPTGATLNFHGRIVGAEHATNPVVTIGDGSTAVTRVTINGLRVVSLAAETIASPSTFTYTSGSVGIQVIGCSFCDFEFLDVWGYETGLQFKASGTVGNKENRFRLGRLRNNVVSLHGAPGAGTETSLNSNMFLGGGFDFGSDMPNVSPTHIKLDNDTPAMTDNEFYSPSLEATGGASFDASNATAINCDATTNLFLGCRIEFTEDPVIANPPVIFGTNAVYNVLNTQQAAPAVTDGGTRNRLLLKNFWQMQFDETSNEGGLKLSTAGDNTYGVLDILNAQKDTRTLMIDGNGRIHLLPESSDMEVQASSSDPPSTIPSDGSIALSSHGSGKLFLRVGGSWKEIYPSPDGELTVVSATANISIGDTTAYGIKFARTSAAYIWATGSGGYLNFRTNGASTDWLIIHTDGRLEINGDLDHDGTNAGFYGTAPVAKQTITGARDTTEAALANLLTALEALGLITDSTTAS